MFLVLRSPHRGEISVTTFNKTITPRCRCETYSCYFFVMSQTCALLRMRVSHFCFAGLCRRFLLKAGMTCLVVSLCSLWVALTFVHGGSTGDVLSLPKCSPTFEILVNIQTKSVRIVCLVILRLFANSAKSHLLQKEDRVTPPHRGEISVTTSNNNIRPRCRCGTYSCQFDCHDRGSGYLVFCFAELCRGFLLKAGMTCLVV